MLWKLMKHEFRATARIFVPLYLAVFAVGLLANLAIGAMARKSNGDVSPLEALIMLAVSAVFAAMLFLTIWFMFSRFYQSLMTDEGYLVFTLPVNIAQIIFSKLIVSLIWFLMTAGIVYLTLYLMALNAGTTNSYWLDKVSDLLNTPGALLPKEAPLRTEIAAELISLAILSVIKLCLMAYASIAIGQSFRRNKVLLSIVFFFAFYTVIRFIGDLALITMANRWDFAIVTGTLWSVPMVPKAFGGAVAVCFLLCVGFYFLTHYMLKRRLNLQ